MSTNNPFAKHTSTMFASRGCDIDEALVYANDVITAMPTDVQAHAMTALMVVINTASNAWAQSQGPSPERIAIIDLIDQRITTHIQVSLNDLDEQVSSKVSAWMSDNLDRQFEDWVNSAVAFEDACDNRIDRWIENNLDVSTQVEEVMGDYDFSEKIEDAINNLDLVVRVR